MSMSIQKLEDLKKDIEKARINQVKLSVQIETIEEELKKLCGTSDMDEIEGILAKQLSQIRILELKIQKQLSQIEEEI